MVAIDYNLWRGATFAIVLVWFVLLVAWNLRLRSVHPRTYRRVGFPVYWANPTKGTWVLGKFLFRGQFLAIGDRVLSAVCITMTLWLVGAVFWMFGPLFGLLSPI